MKISRTTEVDEDSKGIKDQFFEVMESQDEEFAEALKKAHKSSDGTLAEALKMANECDTLAKLNTFMRVYAIIKFDMKEYEFLIRTAIYVTLSTLADMAEGAKNNPDAVATCKLEAKKTMQLYDVKVDGFLEKYFDIYLPDNVE